ncbi:MAG TPA: hypothetical protein PLK99_01265 [Burkholderiales bacterium]|nr:hypothetical protein [Burkholderiales bacterium]
MSFFCFGSARFEQKAIFQDQAPATGTIAFFFVAAMLALTVGLLCFLREIALATGIIRLR